MYFIKPTHLLKDPAKLYVPVDGGEFCHVGCGNLVGQWSSEGMVILRYVKAGRCRETFGLIPLGL